MIACVDVDYRADDGAAAACVLFRDWPDPQASEETVTRVPRISDYVSGEFFRRELPCILAVLGRVNGPVDVVVVDGYAWLGDGSVPGLGAHLFAALGETTPVVGVAKNPHKATPSAVPLIRGDSAKPLYVTAVGIAPAVAADHVRRMHGQFRVPTLLKRVDRLCRDAHFADGP